MEVSNTSIDIRTRSVEKVLVPLIAQVGVLVNHGTSRMNSCNVPQTVKTALPNLELSVCKFTSIGHEMGNSNILIRDDMVESCDTTNKACNIIVSILNSEENENKIEEDSLLDAARMLLSAITKILVLADKTAILKMVKSADKVGDRLHELKNVTNFTEFVNAFSQFGGDMVELAYISGERQNDLKNDLQRAEVCAARALLEKSTMMLLTTCKTCLRHPDSPLALGNRNAVFDSMREAMKILKTVVEDNECPGETFCNGISLRFKNIQKRIDDCLSNVKNFQALEEMLEQLENVRIDVDDVINIEQIDPAKKANIKEYVSQAKKLHVKLRTMCNGDVVVEDSESVSRTLKDVSDECHKMFNELTSASSEQVKNLISHQEYKNILHSFKQASLSGVAQNVEDTAVELETALQRILQVTKLTKNVTTIEACMITATRLEQNLLKLLPQVVDAGKMLSAHPSSKITQENLEVFIDVWDTQTDELIALLGNITQGDAEGTDWLSIYIPMASKLSS